MRTNIHERFLNSTCKFRSVQEVTCAATLSTANSQVRAEKLAPEDRMVAPHPATQFLLNCGFNAAWACLALDPRRQESVNAVVGRFHSWREILFDADSWIEWWRKLLQFYDPNEKQHWVTVFVQNLLENGAAFEALLNLRRQRLGESPKEREPGSVPAASSDESVYGFLAAMPKLRPAIRSTPLDDAAKRLLEEEEARKRARPSALSIAEQWEERKGTIPTEAREEVCRWLQEGTVLSRSFLAGCASRGSVPSAVEFWLSDSQRVRFPLLSAFFLRLAALAPHSAESERMASTSGHQDSSRRASLKPERLSKLSLVAHFARTHSDEPIFFINQKEKKL
jgi:hypothetical protein